MLTQLAKARYISDNICLAMPNGQKLPITGDCQAYIVCEYNTESVRRCPGGTLFDPITHVCNWAFMVHCGQTPTLAPSWQPPTPAPVPVTTARPIVTTNPPYIPTNPPYIPTNPPYIPTAPTPNPTTVQTTTVRPTTTVPPPVTTVVSVVPPENSPYPYCDSDGFYFLPHPSACESYYICAYGMLVLHSCGQGVYWNTETNQCDFPANTNCTNLPNPAKPEDSTPSAGTTASSKLPNCHGPDIFYPSTEDCAKYYICIGSSPILMSCPANYLWNADTSQCLQPERARCSSLIV
ncbi:hypothetical protein quinque_007989 [Culex quinquefasciatus]